WRKSLELSCSGQSGNGRPSSADLGSRPATRPRRSAGSGETAPPTPRNSAGRLSRLAFSVPARGVGEAGQSAPGPAGSTESPRLEDTRPISRHSRSGRTGQPIAILPSTMKDRRLPTWFHSLEHVSVQPTLRT